MKIKFTKHAGEMLTFRMKVTYDSVADAMYIYFAKNKKSTRTEEVSDDFLVDYSDKEMIGIEILDASKKLPKKNLESLRATSDFPGKFTSA